MDLEFRENLRTHPIGHLGIDLKEISGTNAQNPLPLSPLYTLRRIPNIAREGYAYLKHILLNYDELRQYQLFVQDDLGRHIGNHALLRLQYFATSAMSSLLSGG